MRICYDPRLTKSSAVECEGRLPVFYREMLCLPELDRSSDEFFSAGLN